MASRADWLQDMVQLFVDLSLGVEWDGSQDLVTWAIFRDGRSPKRQHTAIQLMRGSGEPDPDLVVVRRKTFQVMVTGDRRRTSTDTVNAAIKAQEIYDKIHTQVASVVTGSDRVFAVIVAQQEPTLIGRDENANFVYSFNVLTEFREEVT